uniref:Uncharacterized protein n=1 Tax=Caenorhabditis japonica TaxID=281687 RepID=A0A8R1EQV9_CAEJA
MEHLEEKEDDHEEVMESVQSGSNSSLGGPMEETWARTAEEEEVNIRRRRKLLKGFDEFLRNSVKVEEEVLEKLGFNTTCSRQTRSAVVAPLRNDERDASVNADNADDLERSFIEVRNAKESAEELRDEYEMLKEEFSSSRSKWVKEKEQLKNTVRDLSKTAEKWRRRAEEAEMAAKRGQMFEEKNDESDEESEAREDYLSMRERLRRRSCRQDMSTDSARRPSGQEARQEKKKCSGASKWDKNSARWDEKVAKWPNGAWLERGDRKTRCSEWDGETRSGSRSSTSQKSTAETVK